VRPDAVENMCQKLHQ